MVTVVTLFLSSENFKFKLEHADCSKAIQLHEQKGEIQSNASGYPECLVVSLALYNQSRAGQVKHMHQATRIQ